MAIWSSRPSSRPTTIGKRKERLESLADDLAAQRSQVDVTPHRLEPGDGASRGTILSFRFTGR